MFHTVGIAGAPTIQDRPLPPQAAETPPGADAGGAALVPAVAMAVAALLLFLASWYDGAFALRSWAPLALLVLLLLALLPYGRPNGAAVLFVCAFAAFAAWTVASAIWSATPGAALEGGGRAALYAGLVALPVLSLPSRRAADAIARLLCGGCAAIVALTLVALAIDGASHFLVGRLNDPTGYRNATAALFALCFWPLVAVAARRASHPLLRAVCFALAVAALGLAYLTQSRGVLLGFGCGAVVAIALGPDRLRRAWLTILAVCAVAVASNALLAPYDAYVELGRTDPGAVADALSALWSAVAAAFVVALLAALLDGGLRIHSDVHRGIRVTAGAALVLVTLAALIGGVARTGDPFSLAQRKYEEFKQVEVAAPGESRLGSTGGQRYDLWRIAWRAFESRPVTGVGEGSYATRYYRERATDRNLNTPHSLPLRALAELGLVGFVLLAGGVAAAAAALLRGRRAATPDQRRWASALAAAGAVALGQSTVDWLWLIPGLMGLGLVCLATAVAVVSLPESPTRGPALRGLPGRLLAGAAAMLVAMLFVSDAYVRTARAAGSEDRLAAARTAERLNPYALPARYLQASALEELGRRGASRQELQEALELEPESFVTLGLLGDLETRAGRPARARAYYRRALALNPGDVGLQQLAR